MLQSRPAQDNCRTRKRRCIAAGRVNNTGSNRLERGFALLEVLAAIIILSIVSLVLMSYFTNALSYASTNQNKTVMVNLARNALFYVEKQDFKKVEKYFNLNEGNYPDISAEQCIVDSAGCSELFSNSELLESVLNPTINGVVYNIMISYQSELHTKMKAADSKVAMAAYLLPVKVTVRGAAGSKGRTNDTVVEGYITDDKIR